MGDYESFRYSIMLWMRRACRGVSDLEVVNELLAGLSGASECSVVARVDRHGSSKAEASRLVAGRQQRHCSTKAPSRFPRAKNMSRARVVKARAKAKLSHLHPSATSRSCKPPQPSALHSITCLRDFAIQSRERPCHLEHLCAAVPTQTKPPPVIPTSISTCNPCAFRISHAAYKNRSFFWAQLSCARRQKLSFPTPVRRPCKQTLRRHGKHSCSTEVQQPYPPSELTPGSCLPRMPICLTTTFA